MKLKYLLVFGLFLATACSKTDTPVPEEKPAPVTPPTTGTGGSITISSYAPTSAKAGDELTVTGTGFGTDMSRIIVTFADGTSATVKSVTETKIVLTVPITINGQITFLINGTTLKPTQLFTFVRTSDYIVKTIGVSRIAIVVDANQNLTLAELYGDGNRVILKSGSGNTMTVLGTNISTIPDGLGTQPQGTLPFLDKIIDNGDTAVDTSGTSAFVLKLKGFDKSKTGYNQLNIVLHKLVYKPIAGNAGYKTNLSYNVDFNKANGKTNANYQSAYLNGLFSGNINVTTVEIAKPKSQNPYIIRDQMISGGQAVTGIDIANSLNTKLTNYFYLAKFANSSAESIAVGSPLKYEWVNADNAVIEKATTYTYIAKFSNMMTNGYTNIVQPSDTTNHVFLRITGFDANACGFNQLRLFPAKDGFSDGGMQVVFNDKPNAAPNLDFIKKVYTTSSGLYCIQLQPNFPSY
ncbi:IPT/TIG domain-containing protein [Pedobacter sp. KACC 23697]|uniref:IPT/TIG domain-containing protein n=1 Tax=Pedobacter sp. KACC 23697 TaxID=3149230 RepID=A0AAU7K6A2_9SPHI